jgi:hypothetical protein
VHTVYSQSTSSNNRFEFAPFGRPTRKQLCCLLAAQPGRSTRRPWRKAGLDQSGTHGRSGTPVHCRPDPSTGKGSAAGDEDIEGFARNRSRYSEKALVEVVVSTLTNLFEPTCETHAPER